MLNTIKAFMKPQDAEQLDKTVKTVLWAIAETRALAEKNNKMLVQICKKEGLPCSD